MDLKEQLINIDPNDVINDAREAGLEVYSLADFTSENVPYYRIEDMMKSYKQSFARSSAVAGLTAGIGGFTTSVTFAGISTAFLSFRLFRLAQRFAILNGFDWRDPLHKNKVMNIYFESLGINAVAQGTLKHYLLSAGKLAAKKRTSDKLIYKMIKKTGRLFGTKFSRRRAARFIPVLGGAAGAVTNYSFAKTAANSMQKAFKEASVRS